MTAWFDLSFDWLWRTSVQASVLIVLVLGAQAAFQRWLKPKWQHALGVLVLIRLLLPFAPESNLSIFNIGGGFSLGSANSRHPLPPGPFAEGKDLSNGERDGQWTIDADSLHEPFGRASLSQRAATERSSDNRLAGTDSPYPVDGLGARLFGSEAFQALTAETSAVFPPIQSQEAGSDWRLVPALQWAWALGFGVIVLLALWRHRRFSDWVKTQPAISDGRIAALLDDAKEVMGITAQVGVRNVERLGTPALFGLQKPCLLLPAGVIERLGDAELRMVMLHELAHLKRRDILLNWIMILVRALHWFNPLVWLAMRRLRADRELVCDEMVIAQLNADGRRLYGHTLIKLLEQFSMTRLSPGLVPVISHKTEIKRRITMIAQFKPANRFAIGTSVGLIALLCLLTFTRAADEKIAEPTTKAGSEKQNRQPQGEYFKNPWKGAPEANMPTAANAGSGGKWESARVVAVDSDTARNEGSRSVAPGIAPLLRVGTQPGSTIKVLENQLKIHEEQLNQAQQRMDQLRRDLGVADIVSSDGAVRSEEPETARMIERDRVTAKSLQAQYETLHRSLGSLSKDALRSAIPTASPDAILTELLIKLSLAESEQAGLSQEFATDHPKLKSLSSLIKNLNAQVDARVEGILTGLEAQAKAQVARAAYLGEELEKSRKRDAELTERYRPYFQAKRNVETQQRIYETIKLRLLQETVDAALPPGPGRNTKLPVPLTRDTIAFQPHYPGMAGTYDRIVVLGSNVGELRGEAKSEKIIANIAAGAERARFAVARISMLGEHPELIERINLKRERLLDAASGVMAGKTMADVEKPGFRALLKAEILSVFNKILGEGTLHEIIITEFVVQ